MSSVQLIESSGSISWITSKSARRLIKDNLVSVVARNPFTIVEHETVARMWSSRYVKSRRWPLRLMADHLRGAILRSKTGESAGIESEEHRACRMLKDDKHVRTAHGWGREE